MITCLKCLKSFSTDNSLHRHLKSHDLKVAAYYQKYFPKYDRHTGQPIDFINKEQYEKTDFATRKNLVAWLKIQPTNEAKDYVIKLFNERKARKDLIYAPCQVELRSLMMPSAITCQNLFGSYPLLCSHLGLKNKYKYSTILDESPVCEKPKIIVDTREQLPLKFGKRNTHRGLKFGDYATKQNPQKYFFERKSLADFAMTFSAGLERFEKEIIRAKEAGAYLIILVESSLVNAINFDQSNQYFARKIRFTPEYVFRNVRDLIQRYEHIQFLFVHNREISAEMILKIGNESTDLYKTVDLQYFYDLGVL